MRVLYVINTLGTGGTERSMAELMEPLSRLGVDPTVAVLQLSAAGVEQAVRSQSIPVEVLGTQFWRALPSLRASLSRFRPSLIHTALFESDIAGRLAAPGSGVPVISSLVNTSYEPERLADPNVRRWRLEGVRWVDGFTGRHLTAHFHSVSHSAKQSAVRRLKLDPDTITVIERGRDPGRLGEPGLARRRRSRVALGLHPEDEVVVSVGRHEFQKNQAVLIEAIGHLSERDRLVLLIAGRRGHASTVLEGAIARLPDPGKVRLLGYRDDLPDVLAAADLFVLTSRFEGLPGAVIEAMALGLPIVAGAIPPVREVVEAGENAFLLPPGDSAALAEAMRRLLEDTALRHRMGLRSRALFLDRFTLDRSARLMADLYERVIETHQARRSP
jgi:glycosyltransferase involved in cell wall biosynthesis